MTHNTCVFKTPKKELFYIFLNVKNLLLPSGDSEAAYTTRNNSGMYQCRIWLIARKYRAVDTTGPPRVFVTHKAGSSGISSSSRGFRLGDVIERRGHEHREFNSRRRYVFVLSDFGFRATLSQLMCNRIDPLYPNEKYRLHKKLIPNTRRI